jgi:uncharacterized protein YndB with AHSA1/START domain
MTVLPTIKPNLAIASPPLPALPLSESSVAQAALEEAVAQLTHAEKDKRIRAAKLIHQVAAIHPQRVAPFLARLLPALDFPETQTRWMIVRAIGLCASQDPQTAMTALPTAQKFLRAESGATLWNATLVYLGNSGATSAENASHVLPLLTQAITDLPQQTKAIFESLARLLDSADIPTMMRIAETATQYIEDSQPGVRASARKIVKRISDYGLIPAIPVASLSLHHRIQVSAQPQRVYDAMTHSSELNHWFTTMSFVDARPGGTIHFRWERQQPGQPVIEDGGPVLQATRPERFAFRWHPHRIDYTTTVTIDFQPSEEGTLLQLYENGFEDSPEGSNALAESSARWVEALARLKVYIENAN